MRPRSTAPAHNFAQRSNRHQIHPAVFVPPEKDLEGIGENSDSEEGDAEESNGERRDVAVLLCVVRHYYPKSEVFVVISIVKSMRVICGRLFERVRRPCFSLRD